MLRILSAPPSSAKQTRCRNAQAPTAHPGARIAADGHHGSRSSYSVAVVRTSWEDIFERFTADENPIFPGRFPLAVTDRMIEGADRADGLLP